MKITKPTITETKEEETKRPPKRKLIYDECEDDGEEEYDYEYHDEPEDDERQMYSDAVDDIIDDEFDDIQEDPSWYRAIDWEREPEDWEHEHPDWGDDEKEVEIIDLTQDSDDDVKIISEEEYNNASRYLVPIPQPEPNPPAVLPAVGQPPIAQRAQPPAKRREHGPRVKYWVFTAWFPAATTADDASRLSTELFAHLRDCGAGYISMQAERGARGEGDGIDRLHFQGYVEFEERKRLSALKGAEQPWLNQVHWEPRRGTQQEAIAYTVKEDTRVCGPYTYGEPEAAGQGQGKRSDLHRAVDLLAETQGNLEAVAEMYPVTLVRAANGLRTLAYYKQAKRSTQTHGLVFFGGTGVGKSTLAKHLWPEAFWWSQLTGSGKHLWADGYAGQKVVICDDWELSALSRETVLALLNHTPMTLQTKGGTVQFVAELMVFTTNIHPHNVWGDDAVRRRLCGIYDMQKTEWEGHKFMEITGNAKHGQECSCQIGLNHIKVDGSKLDIEWGWGWGDLTDHTKQHHFKITHSDIIEE